MPKRKQKKAGGDKWYVGIDPGKKGAIVMLSTKSFVSFKKMPEDLQDLHDLLYGIAAYNPKVALERVHARPGEGRSSIFTFGKGLGHLEMGLVSVGLGDYVSVTPQTWIKPLGLPPREKGPKKNSGKTEWKNKLRAVAQQLYPHLTVTLQMADALLIAHYLKSLDDG